MLIFAGIPGSTTRWQRSNLPSGQRLYGGYPGPYVAGPTPSQVPRDEMPVPQQCDYIAKEQGDGYRVGRRAPDADTPPPEM